MRKKLLSLLAIVVLLAFAAGCGKNAGEEPKGGNSASNSTGATGGKSESNSSGTGAGSNSSGTGTGTSTTTPTTPKEEKKTYEKVTLGPLKAGESAKIGPLTVTLKQVNVVDKAAGLPQGYVHLMTELVIANEDSPPYTVNITDHYKLETPEGKKAPYNVQATANRTPRLQGTLEKGQSVTGWIGYLSKRVAGSYKYMFIHPDYGEVTWTFSIQ